MNKRQVLDLRSRRLHKGERAKTSELGTGVIPAGMADLPMRSFETGFFRLAAMTPQHARFHLHLQLDTVVTAP